MNYNTRRMEIAPQEFYEVTSYYEMYFFLAEFNVRCRLTPFEVNYEFCR